MNLHKCLFVILPFFLVLGCSHNPSNRAQEKSAPQSFSKVVQSQAIIGSKPSDDWESSIEGMKSLSIVTSGGLEVKMNPEKFRERFQKFPTWTKTEQIQTDFKYTVLIQSDSGPSKALSIARNGIEWDDSFYTGDGIDQLISFIKESIGQNLFSQIKPKQLTVESKDMEDKKQVLEKDIKPIFEQLKKASYIQGTPRLPYPLFPNYVLEMDNDGKEGIRVDVMSPTLLCVHLDQEKLYFQTADSMYSLLKAQIPFSDYTDQNTKNLFKATDLQVIDSDNQKLTLNREKLNDFEAQAVIQNIVRLTIGGEKIEGKEKSNSENGIMLLFTVEGKQIPLKVDHDSFEFQHTIYQKTGILEELSKLVDRDDLFKRVK